MALEVVRRGRDSRGFYPATAGIPYVGVTNGATLYLPAQIRRDAPKVFARGHVAVSYDPRRRVIVLAGSPPGTDAYAFASPSSGVATTVHVANLAVAFGVAAHGKYAASIDDQGRIVVDLNVPVADKGGVE